MSEGQALPVTAVEETSYGGVRVVFGNPIGEHAKDWSSVAMTRDHWDAIIEHVHSAGSGAGGSEGLSPRFRSTWTSRR